MFQEVSLDVEVLEVRESSLETRLACRGLRTASGSGEVRLPEELEWLATWNARWKTWSLDLCVANLSLLSY